jgi:ABC-type transport system involved in Fe-S cluster assembly fused permease/ATPase subunit
VYFCLFFDVYFAFIVIAVMTLYIFATIKITDWRTELRRDMVTKSREEFAIKNDSISNYETVKVIPLRAFNSHSTSTRKSTSLDDIERQWRYTRLLKRKHWVVPF